MDNLRQSVNGKAMVRTRCTSQDHEVEEMTEIVGVSGCIWSYRPVRLRHPAATGANSKSTLYADLADLTTPASVEPQTFSQCTGVDGPVLIRAMSRTGPRKSSHAVRRSSPPNTVENAEAQIRRHDLSFFFPDEAKTKKAARALEQAVRRCGGKEWPDEDDLLWTVFRTCPFNVYVMLADSIVLTVVLT
jgi:hypothetical protein